MSRLVNAMTSVFGIPPAPPPPGNARSTAPGNVVPNTDPAALPVEGNNSAPAAPPAPLAKFEKFWDTPVVDPKAPQAPKSFLEGVTAENVAAAAAKVDFRQSIKPAQLEAVAKGGAAGVQAMMDIINQVGQDVYTRGALATTAIVAEAKKETRADVDRDLPKRIRDTQVRGSANVVNPIYSNPALAPMIRALETQAAAQNPGATPAEVAAMVNEYMTGVAQTLTTPNPTQTNQAKPGTGENVDWDSFADS